MYEFLANLFSLRPISKIHFRQLLDLTQGVDILGHGSKYLSLVEKWRDFLKISSWLDIFNEHFKQFFKYGRDFTIQAMNSSSFSRGYIDNTAMITLVEGQNEIAFASQRRQILLQELVVYQSLSHTVQSCVRMVIKMEKSQLKFVKYVNGSSLAIGIFTVIMSQKTSVNIEGAYFYA